ncbi:ULP1 like protease with a chlamydin like cysteine protease domain [Cryptosporidium ryanae]|uniref:ULP1 like protease with a chlamydin like cysteine protease domain n=1 Tax=Cryptosporidium ryanae TaxID=515981 RepID=UPI003519EFB9|nr:ULP1 like protease with a chlamydin like cysteine protease domain [Cryptosporidium ryanae]
MSGRICLSKTENERNGKESECKSLSTCEKVELNGICIYKEQAVRQILKNEYLDDLTIDFFLELAKEICLRNDGNVIDLETEEYVDIVTETECLDDEEKMKIDTKKGQEIMVSYKNKSSNRADYCVLTSLFSTILSGCRENLDDYMCIRRWLKKLNTPILLSDVIVIPMHCSSSSHWWLIIVCYPWRMFELRNSRIRFKIRSDDDKNRNSCGDGIKDSSKGWIVCMDSLGNRNVSTSEKKKQVLKIIRFLNVEYYTNSVYLKYISSEDIYIKSPDSILKMDQDRLLGDWFVLHSPKNVPYQENSFDCGVYVIEYIHLLFHLGTEMFNNMSVESKGKLGCTDKNSIFNTRWISNRRNAYSKVIDFISCNTNWTNDTCLRNRLVCIFDDNIGMHVTEKNKELKHSSLIRRSDFIRKRFSMCSFNKNYFLENRGAREIDKEK